MGKKLFQLEYIPYGRDDNVRSSGYLNPGQNVDDDQHTMTTTQSRDIATNKELKSAIRKSLVVVFVSGRPCVV